MPIDTNLFEAERDALEVSLAKLDKKMARAANIKQKDKTKREKIVKKLAHLKAAQYQSEQFNKEA